MNTGPNLTAMADANLPREILAHLPTAESNAAENLARIKSTSMPKLQAIQAQLREVSTPKVQTANKLVRLRYLASEFTGEFAAKTACAIGCSHCCNINTNVPRSEAKLIAKALGLKVTEPREIFYLEESESRQNFFGVPCSFLANGKCSIYKNRPMVCRTLVNMDSIDLLCRLIPGAQVPVPYLNTVDFQGYFALLTQTEQFADIRDWFPNGLD